MLRARLHNVSTTRDDSGRSPSTPVHSRRLANRLLLKGLVPEPQRRQSVARSGRIRFDSFPAQQPSLSVLAKAVHRSSVLTVCHGLTFIEHGRAQVHVPPRRHQVLVASQELDGAHRSAPHRQVRAECMTECVRPVRRHVRDARHLGQKVGHVAFAER